MHKEILTDEQLELLPLIKSFSDDFGLVGGTAIALHLGHRRSIDFDLFSLQELDALKIRKKIVKFNQIDKVFCDEPSQFSLQIKGVRFTFLTFPYLINFSEDFEKTIGLPELLVLAAMKAFALGRRAKWKDYVDICFIARRFGGIKEICAKAQEIFGKEFNEKLFRAQLAYFEDINYSEAIIFMPGFEADSQKIKQELTAFGLM